MNIRPVYRILNVWSPEFFKYLVWFPKKSFTMLFYIQTWYFPVHSYSHFHAEMHKMCHSYLWVLRSRGFLCFSLKHKNLRKWCQNWIFSRILKTPLLRNNWLFNSTFIVKWKILLNSKTYAEYWCLLIKCKYKNYCINERRSFVYYSCTEGHPIASNITNTKCALTSKSVYFSQSH